MYAFSLETAPENSFMSVVQVGERVCDYVVPARTVVFKDNALFVLSTDISVRVGSPYRVNDDTLRNCYVRSSDEYLFSIKVE